MNSTLAAFNTCEIQLLQMLPWPFFTDKEGRQIKKLTISFQTAVHLFRAESAQGECWKKPIPRFQGKIELLCVEYEGQTLRNKQTAKYLGVLSLMTSPTGNTTLIPYVRVKKHGTGDEVNTYYCRQEQCYLMYALVLPHLDYSSSLG